MANRDDPSHQYQYIEPRWENPRRYSRPPAYSEWVYPEQRARREDDRSWEPDARQDRNIHNHDDDYRMDDYQEPQANAGAAYRRNSLLDRIEPERSQDQSGRSLQERIAMPPTTSIPLAQRIGVKLERPEYASEREPLLERVAHEREETPLPETDPDWDSQSVIEVIDLTMASGSEEEGQGEDSWMDAQYEEGEVAEGTLQQEPVVHEIDDDEEESTADECAPPKPELLQAAVGLSHSALEGTAPADLPSRTSVSQAVNNAPSSTSIDPAEQDALSRLPRPTIVAEDVSVNEYMPDVGNPLNKSVDRTLEVIGSAQTTEQRAVPADEGTAENSILDDDVTGPQHTAESIVQNIDNLMSTQLLQESESAAPAVIKATRRELLVLIVKNVSVQHPDAILHKEHVEKTVLYDERCLDFMKQAVTVARQLDDRQQRLDAEESRVVSSAVITETTKRPLEEAAENGEPRSRKRTNCSDDSHATLVGNFTQAEHQTSGVEKTSAMDVDVSTASQRSSSSATWVQAHGGRDDFYDPNLPAPKFDRLSPSVLSLLDKAKHILSSPAVLPSSTGLATKVSLSEAPLTGRTEYITQSRSSTNDQETCQVPGLWFVKLGSEHSDILECHFTVSEEVAAAARRWTRRDEEFDADDTHVCVRLLCLPRGLVEAALQGLPGDQAVPEDVAKIMAQVVTEWPPRGSLMVDMNMSQSNKHVWFAESMSENGPPLDVTSSIVAGENHFRIIQLADLSDRLFVLHAGPPPENEIEAARLGAQLARKVVDQRESSARSTGINFNIQVKHTVLAI
ncbi:hypothetical protein OE88DRAFT_368505 [Heliocybe sulcata]|uniref:Uncharacterized protein n=1 Tax=Heliocybe sulcata TaxID=5364 RepID=A0A5C3MXV7_9AGAM|nr:hypothetical protein OE88DRAFT_368505 [Heliocybe sulcata]